MPINTRLNDVNLEEKHGETGENSIGTARNRTTQEKIARNMVNMDKLCGTARNQIARNRGNHTKHSEAGGK